MRDAVAPLIYEEIKKKELYGFDISKIRSVPYFNRDISL